MWHVRTWSLFIRGIVRGCIKEKIVTKILFVCLGNICRSPMAEMILKDMVRKAGCEDEFEIASAATSTEEIGNPIYPSAVCELAAHGIEAEKRGARQMTRHDYEYYDLLIGMDDNNLRNMRRIAGLPIGEQGKIRSLLSFASEDYARHGCAVADPWYTGDFAATYRDLVEGCRGILNYFEI